MNFVSEFVARCVSLTNLNVILATSSFCSLRWNRLAFKINWLFFDKYGAILRPPVWSRYFDEELLDLALLYKFSETSQLGMRPAYNPMLTKVYHDVAGRSLDCQTFVHTHKSFCHSKLEDRTSEGVYHGNRNGMYKMDLMKSMTTTEIRIILMKDCLLLNNGQINNSSTEGKQALVFNNDYSHQLIFGGTHDVHRTRATILFKYSNLKATSHISNVLQHAVAAVAPLFDEHKLEKRGSGQQRFNGQ